MSPEPHCGSLPLNSMDLISNIRSFLHRKPRELIAAGDIAATIANCGGTVAQAEQFPTVMDFFARELIRQHPDVLEEGKVGCFVSASPEGLVLTSHLAHLAGAHLASIRIEDGVSKLDRHHLVPKENVVLVLDECKNFIRLNEAMTILVNNKVQVTAVVCVVNASGVSELSFLVHVPILALHNEPRENGKRKVGSGK